MRIVFRINRLSQNFQIRPMYIDLFFFMKIVVFIFYLHISDLSTINMLHIYFLSVNLFCAIFMALGIYQVTYSDRKFCRSVCPGFASLGTSG